jgi:hypothetical protein
MTYSNENRVDGAIGHAFETAFKLTELQNTHSDLMSGMAVMDAVIGQPVADSYRHSNARWRLSQAGLKASILLGSIFSYLLPRVASGDAAVLRSIQATHVDFLRTATEHVRNWPIDKIEEDWAGYCGAYRAFQWNLTTCIAAEKRQLYPMLTKEALSRTRRQAT